MFVRRLFMRLIVLNSIFRPHHRGGAEIVTQATVDGLLSAGHQVAVITLADRQDKPVEYDDGLTIYRLKAANIFNFFSLSERSFGSRALWHFFDIINFYQSHKIKKIIKKYQPDKIITHGLKGLGYPTARLTDVLVLHDVQYQVPSGLLSPDQKINFLYRLYGQLIKIIIGSPKTVVSPSRWLLDFYGRSGFFQTSQKKILINPTTQTLVKNNIAISQPPKLLFVGQLEEHKGIIWLVEILKNSPQDFILQIVGRGSAVDQLKKIIDRDRRFEICGRQDGLILQQTLVQSDLLIVPSLVCENSPTVIALAQASGLAVVASNVGGISEMVAQDWLFAPGDQKSFWLAFDKFLAGQYQPVKKPTLTPVDYATKLLA